MKGIPRITVKTPTGGTEILLVFDDAREPLRTGFAYSDHYLERSILPMPIEHHAPSIDGTLFSIQLVQHAPSLSLVGKTSLW